ncbi:MAG TPA: helical backbone metal receptor [Candidatus Kapabacteria bacterium]|nr:helical backbone metal receptor [Candidatus Kapabacteria bacterium]
MICIDDLGRKVNFQYPPTRIISLVPSITELLYELNIGDNIVAKTKFCIHPKIENENITLLKGTKNFEVDKIIQLRPDIVIANKEENSKDLIEELLNYCPVYITDVNNITSALKMIIDIGAICNKNNEANILATNIRTEINNLPKMLSGRAAYLIWKQPLMSITGNTFINSMLELIGIDNIFKNREGNYPEVTQQEIIDNRPDYIFLSTEPYRFTNVHIPKFQSMFPNSKVLIIDGEMCSWYGSRMLKAIRYLNDFQSLLLNSSVYN